MMYKRGPRTEPCGRPYGAGTHRDLVESWTTLSERSWRKEFIHPRKLPDNPNVTCNHVRRISWSTVSNMALTSNRANNVSSVLSIAPYMSDRSGAVEFRLNFLKPDWHGGRRLFLSMWTMS